VPCSASRVVPGAHRVVGPGTRRGSGPRDVHTTSASHDLPSAPTDAWAMAQSASTTTDTCGGTIPHAMQIQQLAAMQAVDPGKSLNAGLNSCAAIPSPSSLALPHASSCPRHSSTPYDELEPRLRLKHGGLVEYSGRLWQTRTTRRRHQTSQGEQPRPATRRLPRPGCTTPLQCVLTNSDARRGASATKQCTSLSLPPCAPPLVTIKGRGGQRLQGLDLL
jgi:hypothetical protein